MSFMTINGRKIRTENVCPPIPTRDMDWGAVDDNEYDCDCDEDGYFSTSPVGTGPTEQAAIDDLMAQLED